MDQRALVLLLWTAVANGHLYFGNPRPNHAYPHMIHSMINAHRNMLLGNPYNQPQQDLGGLNPIENRFGMGLSPGYQQNNMGYQRPVDSSGQDNFNSQPQQQDSSDLSNISEGLPPSTTSDNSNEEMAPTPLHNTSESPKEVLHLNDDNSQNAANSTKPTQTNANTADKVQSLNTKKDANSLNENNKETDEDKHVLHSAFHQEQETGNHQANRDNEDSSLKKKSNLEKESLKVNSPRDPDAIVFPDKVSEVRKEARERQTGDASIFPNKFNDTPQILYAVSIAPTGSNQWASGSNTAPLTNSIVSQSSRNIQSPPLTSSQSYTQNNPSQPVFYATIQSPNQVPLTNRMSEGNSIMLPNGNGGSTLYTIINVPNSATNVPNPTYQTGEVVSNPLNYQQAIPGSTTNTGIATGTPTYYVVSVPNQQSTQNLAVNQPYTNTPTTYTVGYISSNGQTVLVPNTPIVYQLVPQNYAPVSGNQGVQNTYVPVSNVQGNVVTQLSSGSQDVAVSPQISSMLNPQSYVTVSNNPGTGNAQVNYVPVSNSQEDTGNAQAGYVPSSDQVTLASSPSESVVLPPNTESITLLGFKDKAEQKDKPKKKS